MEEGNNKYFQRKTYDGGELARARMSHEYGNEMSQNSLMMGWDNNYASCVGGVVKLWRNN